MTDSELFRTKIRKEAQNHAYHPKTPKTTHKSIKTQPKEFKET